VSIITTPNRDILSGRAPEAWDPLLRTARFARRLLERFPSVEVASSTLLLVAATIALVWANSRWAGAYVSFWQTPLGVRVGSFAFERSLAWFVNDVLMVIFFFVVGLEIRREVHMGELSEWRRAALPAAAALGGMLAPAALYLLVAGGVATRSGWGVPMATDIAFAVGILALLGKRVPPALRVLLLALAVIDDLGAIVVIALFYSSGVAFSGCLIAALGLGAVFLMQRFGFRAKLAYIAAGILVWAGIYSTGIHPTIAGVIVGLITPVRAWLGPDAFALKVQDELEHLAEIASRGISAHELAHATRNVYTASREVMSPAESLVETLRPLVAFGIMPLFALANAGVSVSGGAKQAASWTISTGVAVGLMIGKPVGVLLASWLMLRLRIGILPAGVGASHLIVLGLVAGVGFTMALFVSQLAFSDEAFRAAAKLGVLVASGGSAVLALAGGRILLRPVPDSGAATTVGEAETSTEV